MSKRAEEAALGAYPITMVRRRYDGIARSDDSYDSNLHDRYCFKRGYEQAEKDTIERVCKWLEKNVTYTHPRKGTKTSIVNLNALREAME